jgi:farnesyl-diphosphate farnesyltransferase
MYSIGELWWDYKFIEKYLTSKYFEKPLYPRDPSKESDNVKRCYFFLHHTSRSFAAVTEALHPELREVVMIFYLVLRALDTIEDDTSLSPEVRVPILRSFKDNLKTRDWTFNGSSPTEKDRIVLVEFNVVLDVYHSLKPAYQDIIHEMTDRMGNGMADYVLKESAKNYDGVKTIKDYDLYCHHVAGIIGEGLTRMAVIAKFCEPDLFDRIHLHNSMGLFLQKTNIIRDFREDLDEGRSFWPKEVWSKYGKSLVEFTDPQNEVQAIHCVSDLITLSLNHVIDCLDYLRSLNEPTYFRFAAIPQVMSIATLDLIFNNPAMFHKNVKIRRGLTAKLILESKTMDGVYKIFREYVLKIHFKNKPSDPSYQKIEMLCAKIDAYLDKHDPNSAANIQRKKVGQNYNDISPFGIFLVAGASLTVTFGLMIGIAILFGARFDVVFAELKSFANRLLSNDVSADEAKHLVGRALGRPDL